MRRGRVKGDMGEGQKVKDTLKSEGLSSVNFYKNIGIKGSLQVPHLAYGFLADVTHRFTYLKLLLPS